MNSFRCLAIDTSTEQPSVAACQGEKIATRQFGGARETEQIFTHVRHVLTETDQELGDLDCIAIGCGPGSFTGLRVGVAAAQSLAFGADLPVCRLSSLAIIAFGAGRRGHGVSRDGSEARGQAGRRRFRCADGRGLCRVLRTRRNRGRSPDAGPGDCT